MSFGDSRSLSGYCLCLDHIVSLDCFLRFGQCLNWHNSSSYDLNPSKTVQQENIQRRKLDIVFEETEENAKKREFLLPGGFYCLLHAHYENSGISRSEQKIQTEVKEIRKVFYCELCNKQYKLAMEFENHLSAYDDNHRKHISEYSDSSKFSREKVPIMSLSALMVLS